MNFADREVSRIGEAGVRSVRHEQAGAAHARPLRAAQRDALRAALHAALRDALRADVEA